MQGRHDQVSDRPRRRRVGLALAGLVGSLLVVPLAVAGPATAAPAADLPAPTVSASSVVAGGAVTIAGAGCRAGADGASNRVSVSLVSGSGSTLGSGAVTPAADGAWSVLFTVPAATPAGAASFATTCDSATSGQQAYPSVAVTVTAGAPSRWAASDPALPTVPDGRFAAVSCPSTTACTAVGAAHDANGDERPLVASWDGRAWTRQTAPGTGGLRAVSCVGASFCVATGAQVLVRTASRWTVAALGDDAAGTSFGGVSCASTTACTAVGSTNGASTTPAAYAFDGSRWTSRPVPVPAGLYSSFLQAVSCKASSCLAVGNGYGGSGSTRLVASWNGSSWSTSVDPTPLPTSVSSGSLTAVSCSTATTCVVVGSGYGPTGGAAFVERWSGGGWMSEAVPAAASSGLTGVSCTSAAVCTAVGTADGDDGTVAAPYVVTRGQSGWRRASVPPLASRDLELTGVSCAAAGACAAVGGADGAPVVARLAGGAWGAEPTVVPLGNDGTRLNGVSCVSATACVAVGRLDTPAGAQALAETWNGTRWSATAVPDTGRLSTELEDVACTSAVSCVAVGGTAEQGNVNDSYLPALFTWDGTAWTPVPLALPSGARAGHLQSVSCSGAGACVAVGGNDYGSPPLAYAQTPDGWVARTAPVPNGLRSFQFTDVSCVARGGCVALGTGRDQSWGDASRSLTLSGATWSRAFAAPALDALSCSSVRSCVGVGTELYEGSELGSTSVARWDGTTWTPVTTPDPGNGTERAFLLAVSCSSATTCTAVGAADQPFVSRSSSAGWALEAVTGVGRVTLRDVSCPTANSCVAVGHSGNRAVVQVRSAR